MDNPVLLNAIFLSPLILGVIFSQMMRLPLKGLTGVYFLFVIANTLIWYFLMNGQWLVPAIIGLIGFVLAVIVIGFLGQKLKPSDYMLIMSVTGLFPWTLWGVIAAVVYAVIIVLFTILVALRPKFKNPFVRRFK